MIFATAVLLIALAEGHGQQAIVADRILILKSARTMTLHRGGKPLREYKIALGTQPIGAKTRQGDHRTREGEYRIDWKQPQSRFHLALHISYPNAADKTRAPQIEPIRVDRS